ncbi:TPA: glutathione S-transferase family protein [Pseudomonas putida]|nr:glutathione S-transferase family protein [Pseudomonas putida]HDS1799950.1 glutathione S-transferase family protein [Pseudomonas putida]HDS1806344.1 glutathione S-transferase family protein [Pseudomonas putida]
MQDKARDIHHRFGQVEAALGAGPYFSGERFSIVDATFGPVFRYFDMFETIGEFGFFTDLPKVTAWRTQLVQRPAIRHAVQDDYPQRLRRFLLDRGSALSRRIAAGR